MLGASQGGESASGAGRGSGVRVELFSCGACPSPCVDDAFGLRARRAVWTIFVGSA